MEKSIAGRVVVVTGASGGIGLAAVTRFLQAGDRVYGLSRRPPPATALPEGAEFTHIPTDVADPAAVDAAFGKIAAEAGRVDVLVNNAGFGISGAAAFTPPKPIEQIFAVNCQGVFHCVRAAVPHMPPGGRIVNVSSVAAVFVIPFQAYYSASKAAINAYTLALRSELAPLGLTACAVMPGDVRTGFTQARQKGGEGRAVYGSMIDASLAVMEKDEKAGMPPEKVAEVIFRAAGKRRPRPAYVVGGQYRLFVFAARLLPASAINAAVAMMYMKKGRA